MLAAFSDRISKLLEDFYGSFPIDAGISNTNTLLESGWSLGWDLLVAFVNVGFDHDTDDGFFTSTDLVTDDLGYLGLVSVVLVRVS